MANEKRLTWKQSIDGYTDVGLRPGVTVGEAICKLADLEKRKTIPLEEVYRVIAGHSNYHGDNILSALTCIAEGKEVKPVRSLPAVDAVEVVRCKDCKHYVAPQGTYVCDCFEGLNFATDNDFCSYGERKDNA